MSENPLTSFDIREAVALQLRLATEVDLSQVPVGTALIAIMRLMASLVHNRVTACERSMTADALDNYMRSELLRLSDIQAAREAAPVRRSVR